MEQGSGYTEDTALADALSKLELMEKENSELRQGMTAAGEGVSPAELVRLRRQNDELMKVNHQWDCEFRELSNDFQQYRTDSQRALADSKAAIATLKEEKSKIVEKYQMLEERVRSAEIESKTLRARLAAWEERQQERGEARGGSRGGEGEDSGVPYPMVSFSKVKELEDECLMLRHQLRTYREDYAEEYKDRQRMNEEKQSVAVKHEAEVTSLKLQLERTRAELVHYTSEANRLSQQLRMKNQQEEEQYKKHLESQGYLTRSPSGHLPPMDPFVEVDEEKHKLIRRAASGPSQSPRLLTRGVDIMQAYSSSTQAHAVSSSHSNVVTDRSRSPVPILTDSMSTRYGGVSSAGVLPRPPQDSSTYRMSNGYSTPSTHAPISNGRSVSPVPISNGRSVSPGPILNGRSTSPMPITNGINTHGMQYGRGLLNDSSPSTSPYHTQLPAINGGSSRLAGSNGLSGYRTDQNGIYPATQASAFR